MNSFSRSIFARSLMTGVASLAFVAMVPAMVRAETVFGAPGADGANCDLDPSADPTCQGGTGGDGDSVSAGGNPATAVGGDGGAGGRSWPNGIETIDGNGGAGGSGTASATGKSRHGDVTVSAMASGGAGGSATIFGNSGAGGSATASATGKSRRGNVTVSAAATGGAGGRNDAYGGSGGYASATSKAVSRGTGEALSSANAIGGEGGFGVPLLGLGSANASSDAETATGALAQAEASAFGFYGEASSSAKTRFGGVSVQSTAAASFNDGANVTTEAVAQGGRSDQTSISPGETAYAFSTALPDKAYAAALIGDATNVADALLGSEDTIFGTAILGPGGSSTFDFNFRGDLILGDVDDNSVSNLGFFLGPIDLTIEDDGVFVLGGIAAAPETSTWALILIGFAGLGYAGYRRAREPRAA